MGVAVALPDGLIVPVVKEAERKTVSEIATEISSSPKKPGEANYYLQM